MNEWLWNISGMVLSKENRSTGTTTCASVILSTIRTRNGPRSNRGFCGDRPRTNRLTHSTAYRGVFTVIDWTMKKMIGRKYSRIGRNVNEVKGEITNAARACTDMSGNIDFINGRCMYCGALMLQRQQHFSVTSPWQLDAPHDSPPVSRMRFVYPVNLKGRGFTLFPSASHISFYNGRGLYFLWDITWIFKSHIQEFPSSRSLQWFRPSVASVSSRKLGFENMQVHMKFVVDKVALRQGFV